MSNERPGVRDAAFTLVELLVVMGIVAVLAALVLLAISRAKSSAQRIVCVNNLRQLGTALQQFVADHHVYPLDVNPDKAGSFPDHGFSWIESLDLAYSKAVRGRTFDGVWVCPSGKRPATYPRSGPYSYYGYNANGMSAQTETVSLGLGGHFVRRYPSRPPAPPVSESEIASPSDMLALGDGLMGGPGSILDGAAWLQRLPTMAGDAASSSRANARHQGKANAAFCDGHIETPTLKALFMGTNDPALIRWNRDHTSHRERL